MQARVGSRRLLSAFCAGKAFAARGKSVPLVSPVDLQRWPAPLLSTPPSTCSSKKRRRLLLQEMRTS